jgi:hypothetical protein
MTIVIGLTVAAAVGWLVVPGIWRGREPAHYGRREKDGLLASNRRGILASALGVTFFMAAGWVVYLAGQPRPGGEVPTDSRVAAGLLCGVGFVFMVCYVSIYAYGRPRFLVPPSMRPGAATAEEPGGPGRHAAPGSHQASDAGAALEAPATAPVDTSLQPGETLLARIMVNRVQDGRAFGGHMLVTSSRLVFEPVALSRANGAVAWAVPIAQVVGADLAPRGRNPRAGEWRRRLRVRLLSGDVEYFVVLRPRAAADLIERARQHQP